MTLAKPDRMPAAVAVPDDTSPAAGATAANAASIAPWTDHGLARAALRRPPRPARRTIRMMQTMSRASARNSYPATAAANRVSEPPRITTTSTAAGSSGRVWIQARTSGQRRSTGRSSGNTSTR